MGATSIGAIGAGLQGEATGIRLQGLGYRVTL